MRGALCWCNESPTPAPKAASGFLRRSALRVLPAAAAAAGAAPRARRTSRRPARQRLRSPRHLRAEAVETLLELTRRHLRLLLPAALRARARGAGALASPRQTTGPASLGVLRSGPATCLLSRRHFRCSTSPALTRGRLAQRGTYAGFAFSSLRRLRSAARSRHSMIAQSSQSMSLCEASHGTQRLDGLPERHQHLLKREKGRSRRSGQVEGGLPIRQAQRRRAPQRCPQG